MPSVAGWVSVRGSLYVLVSVPSSVNGPITMTDYREEQRNELEALESIYADSFTGEPGPRARVT